MCIVCVAGPNDGSCCTADRPCGMGGGGCDSDEHCREGLVCGSDNCQQYHQHTQGDEDCCERAGRDLIVIITVCKKSLDMLS